jgi:hypothetical protein
MKTSHTDIEPSLSQKQDNLLQSLAMGHSQDEQKKLTEYMSERKIFFKHCLAKLILIEDKRVEEGLEERSEHDLVKAWGLEIENRWKKFSVKQINLPKYPMFDVRPIKQSMD